MNRFINNTHKALIFHLDLRSQHIYRMTYNDRRHSTEGSRDKARKVGCYDGVGIYHSHILYSCLFSHIMCLKAKVEGGRWKVEGGRGGEKSGGGHSTGCSVSDKRDFILCVYCLYSVCILCV